jgi:ArsR family transcriptional regulator
MKCECPPEWLSFFKAAADQHRQQILGLINQKGRVNASQIVEKINLSQPTISHHLKILSEAELILARKKGKQTFYSINEKSIANCCIGFMNRLITK